MAWEGTWETLFRTTDDPSNTIGPCEAHTCVIQPRDENQLLYVFGGYDGKWLAQFKSCSMNQPKSVWKDEVRIGQLPCARSGHSWTWIPSNDQFLLFGGFNGDTQKYYNDVCLFDPTTKEWSLQACTGTMPHCREAHVAQYWHPDQDQDPVLVIQGGYGRQQLGDVFLLNLRSWEWTQVDLSGYGGYTPALRRTLTRSKHSSIWIHERQTLVLFGGDSGAGSTGSGMDTSQNDLITINFDTRVIQRHNDDSPKVILPPRRNGHTLVRLSSKLALMFGGTDGSTGYFSDAFVLDLDTWNWTPVRYSNPDERPASRENHSMTQLMALTQSPEEQAYRVVIFGGCLGIDYTNDMFQLTIHHPKKQKSGFCVVQ